MLSEQGGCLSLANRRSRELYWRRYKAELCSGWMSHIHAHFTMPDLGIVEHLVERVDWSAGNAGCFKNLQPVIGWVHRDQCCELWNQDTAVRFFTRAALVAKRVSAERSGRPAAEQNLPNCPSLPTARIIYPFAVGNAS